MKTWRMATVRSIWMVDTFFSYLHSLCPTPNFYWLEIFRRTRVRFLLASAGIVGIAASDTAHGASFDCSKASTLVESLICADPTLSALDVEMAAAWTEARRASSNPNQLQEAQRAFIRQRGQCRNARCIADISQQRTAELKAISVTASGQVTVAPSRPLSVGSQQGGGVLSGVAPSQPATPAVAQALRHLEILQKEDLRPHRVTPSSSAKAIDDLVGNAQDILVRLANGTDQRGASIVVLAGFARYGESIPFISPMSGASASVLWNFQGDQPQSNIDWIDRCISVGTSSFKNSSKLRRRLDGKLVSNQFVSSRLVVFYSFNINNLNGAERGEINRDLSVLHNIPHGNVMVLVGYTNDNGEIVFSPDTYVQGKIAKSIIITKDITNTFLQATLTQLSQDCPEPQPAP